MSPAQPENENAMTPDYEAEYNNRARVPQAVDIMARWVEQSKAHLAHPAADYDVRHGWKDRNKADYHHANRDKAGPWVVYIHGGYWQRGDRKDYGFLVREFLRRGVNVAIPSYTLCPEASIADITLELRQFILAFWKRTKARPVIVGHSAGGHLAACLMAMDFAGEPDVPQDLIRAAFGLSGVYELEPLVTTSINEALKLDGARARASSPLLGPVPPKDRLFVAAVGANESTEFLRQSLVMTEQWARAGVKAECSVVPGANHFTIVEHLTDPESAMFNRIVDQALHMRNL